MPFLGGNHLPLHFITIDKFWIETTFVVFLVLSVMVAYLKKGKNYGDFLRFFLFFLPFLAMNILSYAYTWNRFATLNSLNTLVWSLGCAYVYLLAENRNNLLKALVTGGFLVALCAIVQHKFLFPGLLDTFKEGAYAQVVREQSGIPFVSYLYHNMVGGYLAFIFPLALYFSVYEPPARSGVLNPECDKPSTGRILQAASPFLFTFFAATIITGIILSSSRIGMGLALLCLILVAIALFVRKAWRGLLRTAGVCLLAAIIAFAVLHQETKTPEVDVRATLDAKMKTAYSQMSTLNTRTDIWQNGLRAFREHPVLGYGAGCFEYGYRKYFDGGTYTGVAHNTLLKHGVELGIIGLLSFLLYCGGVLGFWLKSEKNGMLLVLAGAAVTGFGFSLIDFSFEVPSHVVTFFLLTASFFTVSGGPGKGLLPLFLFLMVIGLSIASLAFTARADQSAKAIENGRFFEENGMFDDAYSSYTEAQRAMPLNNEGVTGILNALTKKCARERTPEKRAAIMNRAEPWFTVADKTGDKDSEIFFRAGKGLAVFGDRRKAEELFGKALYYYPTSAYYVSEVAGFYFAIGNLARAKGLLAAFEPYVEKYLTPHNPKGILIYKIRDLEAAMAHSEGDTQKALCIARRNYADAQKGIFVITSARSREYVPQQVLLKYLKDRVRVFEAIYKEQGH